MRSMFGWSGGPRGLPASSVLWSWKGPRNDGAQSDILRGTQWWIPERYLPWYQCASIKQLPDLDNLDDLGHLDILDPVCSMVPECVAELGRFWLNVVNVQNHGALGNSPIPNKNQSNYWKWSALWCHCRNRSHRTHTVWPTSTFWVVEVLKFLKDLWNELRARAASFLGFGLNLVLDVFTQQARGKSICLWWETTAQTTIAGWESKWVIMSENAPLLQNDQQPTIDQSLQIASALIWKRPLGLYHLFKATSDSGDSYKKMT